ncbi:MAG: nicotinamide riboside transporter PnuC [Bacteroidota bacterium]|nr:nicotinamide riboside transporter PnuC [Bacteroidota bacterium]
MLLLVELISVAFTLLYLYYASRLKPIAWILGILASVSAMILFYQQQLFGSFYLNLIYVIQGGIGFFNWKFIQTQHQPRQSLNLKNHVMLVFALFVLTFGLMKLFTLFNFNEFKTIDVFLAMMCVLATFLEIKKEISTWYYWIIANLLYGCYYFYEALIVYALLSLFLSVFSFKALFVWKRKMDVL